MANGLDGHERIKSAPRFGVFDIKCEVATCVTTHGFKILRRVFWVTEM